MSVYWLDRQHELEHGCVGGDCGELLAELGWAFPAAPDRSNR